MVDTDIMGEKEFFDIMKTNNRFLTMEERHLVASITLAFTEKKKTRFGVISVT